jgi:hypothetical protein
MNQPYLKKGRIIEKTGKLFLGNHLKRRLGKCKVLTR